MITEYDCQGIFYLGMEIIKLLGIEDKPLLMDDYFYVVRKIYKEYQKHDDPSIDWLTCIHNYITQNEDKIRNMVHTAIEW